MARRKRTRQETSFYEVRESFRENARLMTTQQPSFSPSSPTEVTINSHRRSPESVLYESPQVELLQPEELSPEIISKISRVKLSPRDAYEHDDDDEECNVASGGERERRPLVQEEWTCRREDDPYGSKKMDDCYMLDKTLSMNDDLAREIENYLGEEQSSSAMETAIAECRTTHEMTPLLDVAVGELQSRCIAPTHPMKSQQSGEFSHEFEPLESLVCETVDGYDEVCAVGTATGQKNDERNRDAAGMRNGGPSFASWREFRKIFAYLQRLNRKICGKGVAPLFAKRRFSCSNRKFRYVSMTTSPPQSSSSSSSSVASFHTSLLSPKSTRNRNGSAARKTTQNVFANECQAKPDESPRRTKRTETNAEGSVTPCSGSSRSTHRCRGILKFEDEDEEAKGKQKQPAMARAVDRTNDPMLPPERQNKSEKHLYPLNLPVCIKTRWDSCSSSESTPTSSVDLLAVSDGCGSHPREVEYQDGTYMCRISRSIATPRSRGHPSQSRNISYIVIRKVAAFCIWLMRKLLHMLTNGYKKLRRVIVSSVSFSSGDHISSQSLQMKEFGHLIVMLRSENEQMLCVMSEKVTRLSTEFVQVRTGIEAVLGVVTAEVDSVREISRKMNENNIALTQELKKLHEALEEIRLKSARQVSSATSCSSLSSRFPSSLSPPPPSLVLSPKHTTESASSMQPLSSLPPPPPPPPPPLSSVLPPPPPPLPPTPFLSASFQFSSITPTTPNSNMNNRNSVTPTRKCSTPLLNRPSITVEDLLKVTLKKAPQSIKDNRRNTIPGPRGPVVSLDMLRNVKLKSARRRSNDQAGRSPRNGRIVKSRTVPTLSLSPITTGSEGNLERILRQVDINRRGPRRLLSGSISFRDHDFTKDDGRPQSLETLKHSQSQSAIA
ncbi:hypothetical protein EAI_07741 [Harpegnathos saltator]|uniref:Uncharacterized protein n=1 Tax=Harpegnathos saltator TaxID=610380 RepID=E2B526_HARSA|nr:hypothetical protein EAI_07741 [Harpegnathos saltator]